MLLLGCSSLWLNASSFTIALNAPSYAGQRAVLYRYMDLVSLRTERLADARVDDQGHALLQGDAQGTNKAMIRIGDVICDIWLRGPRYTITVPPPAPGTARTIQGARVDPVFTDVDGLDINALLADLNERLDAFLAQDLATDRTKGMQAIDIERKNPGTLKPDTSHRPSTLFITPNLSAARIDTFETKLRKFYAEVKDTWFWQNLDYGIAGLRFGPRANDRELFDRYLKDRPVLYDVPEYIRFIGSFFQDHLLRHPFRTDELAITKWIHEANVDSVKRLFAKHDFLKDDRLCEFVMMRELYANHPGKTFDRSGVLSLLRQLASSSSYPEHRRIASDIVWDLTTMRAGGKLPALTLRTTDQEQVHLDSLLKGPTYLVVTSSQCTYCEQEMIALETLYKEYGAYINIIAVSLDREWKELMAYTREHPARDWTWCYGGDDPQVMDALRLRSIPSFVLLNDNVIAQAPAPPPSNGLAAVLFKLKAQADERNKLKPDQGPPPRR